MSIIEVDNICKEYKYFEHKQGIKENIKNLFCREYKHKKAVENITFQIEKGEIVGYLGANGAGKSTTIKMLTGIITPTSGSIQVMGVNPCKNRKENAKNIGVVFGQRTQLWWDIPLIESFHLNKSLYKLKEADFKKRLGELIDIMDMREFINTPVRQLSLGQRMRGDLCMALLHNPKIVYLDEPTIGLDIVVKENIRQLIKDINRKYETTVILTTHDMGDIEKLCSRVIAIDKGKIIYDGSLEELKDRFGFEEKIIFQVDSKIDMKGFHVVEGISSVNKKDNKCEVIYDRRQVKKTDIITLINKNYDMKDIDIIESDLESIIREMYRGD